MMWAAVGSASSVDPVTRVVLALLSVLMPSPASRTTSNVRQNTLIQLLTVLWHLARSRLANAQEFAEAEERTPFMDAAIADAEARAKDIEAKRAMPLRAPRDLLAAAGAPRRPPPTPY